MLLQGASGRNLSTVPVFLGGAGCHLSVPGCTDVCLERGGQRERRGAERGSRQRGEAGVAAVSVGGSSITPRPELLVKNLLP